MPLLLAPHQARGLMCVIVAQHKSCLELLKQNKTEFSENGLNLIKKKKITVLFVTVFFYLQICIKNAL